MIGIDDPLVAPAPAEIPLENAPLVRVIAQVRFPLVPSVGQRDFIVPFHNAIQTDYPVLREEKTQRIMISTGVQQVTSEPIWRFADVEGQWRVSLTLDFAALETTSYKSRSDFLARFRTVVEAVATFVEPKLVDRLGLRYIDRITGRDVEGIAQLVRAEVRGIAGTPAAIHVSHSLSESMFEHDGTRLLARWGYLPKGATVDPAAIEPIDQPSWILDLDMFSARPRPFAPSQVLEDTTRYAERIYTFFRWAVTPQFLIRYGGKI